MTDQQGICKNKDNCSLAQSGKPIPITSGDLDCPECGDNLTAYKPPSNQRVNRYLLFGLSAAALLISIIGLIYLINMPSPKPSMSNGDSPRPVTIPSPELGTPQTGAKTTLPSAGSQCLTDTVMIGAATYGIGKEYDHFLKRYKEKYIAKHGVRAEPLKIEIKNPFCMQASEVSVAEFKRFLNSAPAGLSSERSELLKATVGTQNDKAPVQNVSKIDAESYADWLSGQSGNHWQLPTMAQWMVAVTLVGEQSPVTDTLDNKPAPARSKTDDEDKIHHLLGNLREWSRDTCSGDRYQLLGRNYISAGIDMAYCNAPALGAPGVGFRLVYQLEGEWQ